LVIFPRSIPDLGNSPTLIPSVKIQRKSSTPFLRYIGGVNIQKMMGHTTLKTITDKYFSYVPNMTHNDGSKFMEEYAKAGEKCGPNEAQAQG
jgi:hypothetical protein